MRRMICKQGEAHPGHVTVTLNCGDAAVIFKTVPADVRENCGEYYRSESVTEKLLAMADEAVRHGVEVEMLRYAA